MSVSRNVLIIVVAVLAVSLIVGVALASCGGGKPKEAPGVTAPAG